MIKRAKETESLDSSSDFAYPITDIFRSPDIYISKFIIALEFKELEFV